MCSWVDAVCRACAVVVLCAVLSGCVSQLGYVPAYTKNESNQAPTYEEAREFAVKVRNGYDTRETLNRYAGYYGAGVAVVAAAAIAALSIYDSGSSALVAIPIGTGLLGGLAGVFQSEEKARVYGRASRYLSDVIIQSDERVEARMLAAEKPGEALAAARADLEVIRRELTAAQRRLAALQEQAADDLRRVAAMPNDEASKTTKKLAQDRASASQRLVSDGEASVAAATAVVERAERRMARAVERARRGPVADKDQRRQEARKAEAFCLQRDVTGVVARVADVLTPLDPKAEAALKAVKGPGGSAPAPETRTSEKPAALSTDFALPAASTCQDDV